MNIVCLLSKIAIILVLGVFFVPVFADVGDEISDRQQQIEAIQQQIDQYQMQIDNSRSQSLTLENEIGNLNAKINQLNLEIRSLQLSINQTNDEIGETTNQVADAEEKIIKHKNALAQYIKIIYRSEQKSLAEILLTNNTLSQFFNNLNNIRANQDNLRASIESIRTLKAELEIHQQDLESKKTDLERLKRLEEIEKRSLDVNKYDKNKILKDTKGEEAKFQELVKRSERDIEAIRKQIFYLEQHGISAEEAVKFGQLAAIRAGIRPAFLIAILEIESGLGRNVGSGNWKDDMYDCYIRLGTIYYPNRKEYYLKRAETEKNAFFVVVQKLGLDPDTVKVSKEPNYGCGGAMGPAQFIPSTWLSYEDEIAELTGHNPPDPWNIEDAFMASAIKLARGGATSQTRAGESGAARAYIGGRTTCSSSICNYYSNAVLRKAAEIEKNL